MTPFSKKSLIGAIALCAVACGGHEGVAPTVPSSITISPSSGSIDPGEALQLVAAAKSASGAVVSTAGITWTSSDAHVATVSAAGLVQGVSSGSARITGTAAGVTSSVDIRVRDQVALSGASSVTAGQIAQLTVPAPRLDSGSYTVRFDNNQTATAGRLDDSTLVVAIPTDRSSGTLSLAVALGPDRTGRASLNVRAAAVISNPTGFADSVGTAVAAQIAGAAPAGISAAAWTADQQLVSALEDSAHRRMSALSPTDQETAARMLAANMANVASVPPTAGAVTPDVAAGLASEEPECADAISKTKKAGDIFIVAVSAVIGTALVVLVGGPAAPAAGAALMIEFAVAGASFANLATRVATFAATCEVQVGLHSFITATASTSRQSARLQSSSAQSGAADVTLTVGQTTQVQVAAQVRPVAGVDIGSVPSATQLAQITSAATEKLDNLRQTMSRITSASFSTTLPKLESVAAAAPTDQPVDPAAVTWTSDKPDVASVSAGLVRANTAGTATITATYRGQSTSFAVVVTAAPSPPHVSISLSPSAATAGESTPVTVTINASAPEGIGNILSVLQGQGVYHAAGSVANAENECDVFFTSFASSATLVCTLESATLFYGSAIGFLADVGYADKGLGQHMYASATLTAPPAPAGTAVTIATIDSANVAANLSALSGAINVITRATAASQSLTTAELWIGSQKVASSAVPATGGTITLSFLTFGLPKGPTTLEVRLYSVGWGPSHPAATAQVAVTIK